MRFRGVVAIVVVIAIVAIFVALSQKSSTSSNAVRPPNWPNLDVLINYSNPFGDTCSEDGTTSRGNLPRADKLEENHLKNRYLLPSRYTAYDVDQMLNLPTNDDERLDDSGASLTGYVEDVKPGGSEGESCNCDATQPQELDAHIEVVSDPSSVTNDGKGKVLVEVTERSRRLADAGLLQTNIGNDWSTRQLKRQLIGHWVKFSGWLFYDPDHAQESWSVDDNDSAGRRNWRGTPWEIHPVMAIEVLPNKPGAP